MTETETRTQKQAKEARKLAMAELHAVKWVASQATVKRVYDGIKPRYQTLRQTAILGWFLVIYEVSNTGVIDPAVVPVDIECCSDCDSYARVSNKENLSVRVCRNV